VAKKDKFKSNKYYMTSKLNLNYSLDFLCCFAPLREISSAPEKTILK
jgi:hypothetical protein